MKMTENNSDNRLEKESSEYNKMLLTTSLFFLGGIGTIIQLPLFQKNIDILTFSFLALSSFSFFITILIVFLDHQYGLNIQIADDRISDKLEKIENSGPNFLHEYASELETLRINRDLNKRKSDIRNYIYSWFYVPFVIGVLFFSLFCIAGSYSMVQKKESNTLSKKTQNKGKK